MVQFTKCPKECRIQHQNTMFISRTKNIKLIEEIDKKHQEIGKEPDPINPEDSPKYI